MIEVLPQERWNEIEGILKTVFDSDLPDPTATILANVEHGEIKSFVIMEFIGRIGQIWNGGTQSRAMFDWFDKQIPPGNSVIAIASEPRFEALCEKFGMRKVPGVVYRKDF
jgi:hypothetical protein